MHRTTKAQLISHRLGWHGLLCILWLHLLCLATQLFRKQAGQCIFLLTSACCITGFFMLLLNRRVSTLFLQLQQIFIFLNQIYLATDLNHSRPNLQFSYTSTKLSKHAAVHTFFVLFANVKKPEQENLSKGTECIQSSACFCLKQGFLTVIATLHISHKYTHTLLVMCVSGIRDLFQKLIAHIYKK